MTRARRGRQPRWFAGAAPTGVTTDRTTNGPHVVYQSAASSGGTPRSGSSLIYGHPQGRARRATLEREIVEVR